VSDFLVILEHYGFMPESLAGDNVLLLCPFHSDTEPSLSVSLEKDLFYCFGCGTTGNVVDFVARIENVNELEAHRKVVALRRRNSKMIHSFRRLQSVSTSAPTPEIYPIPAWEWVWLYSTEKDPRWYPFSRGIEPETLYTWCVGWDSYTRAVVFHIAFSGTYAGWQKRRVDGGTPPYICSPGLQKTGLYWSAEFVDVDQDQPLLLVEGPFDALKAYQFGWHNVAAVLGSLSRAQEALLVSLKIPFVCAFDNDDAGRAYFSRLRKLRDEVYCVDYRFWGGAKDVAELEYRLFWKSIPETWRR